MTVTPVFRVLIRYWKRHKLQALLCFSGVVMGVAVFTAIQMANRGAMRAFAESMEALMGSGTHRVVAPDGGAVPERWFARLVTEPGVLSATPVLQDRLMLPGYDGLPLTMMGFDAVSEAPFRGDSTLLPADTGDGPGGMSMLERLLSVPNGVLLPESLAARLGIAPGAMLEAEIAMGRRQLRVIGLYRPPAGREQAFSGTLLADIATHQELFGRLGELDSIVLMVDPDSEPRVRELLPPGLALERAGSRLERVEGMSRAFALNLEVLGGFALLVAVFLIFNAATFSVVQRRGAIAILRCTGAQNRAIFAALAGEALVLGVVGSCIGLLVGRGLGALMLKNTGATLFEVVLQTDPLPVAVSLEPGVWGIGLFVGVGVSVAGALEPAWSGSRVSPLAAVRSMGLPERTRSSWLRWLGIGAGMSILAAGLILAPGQTLSAGLAGGALLALAGAALCLPALKAVSVLSASLLNRLFGPAGRLAAGNLERALFRNGVATASLMVALSLALAISITVRSFNFTFEVWLNQVITADIYMKNGFREGEGPLPERFLSNLRASPFVRELGVLRSRRLVVADREVTLLALNLASYARVTTIPSRDGTPEENFARLGAGEVIISETLAFPLGLGRGDSIAIPTAGGERTYRIGAVTQNYTNPQGLIYMSRVHFTKAFGDVRPHRAAVWLKAGVSSREAAERIAALPGADKVQLFHNRELRGQAMGMIARTFLITHMMGVLAALVAFLAVVSAMAALLVERMRTLGFLRAIGLSSRGLGLSMALEAALIACTATVMAWATGLAMAVVLVFVINRRAFGWTLQFHPEEGPYLWLLLLALCAALLGAAYPIYRATRLSISATIREE